MRCAHQEAPHNVQRHITFYRAIVSRLARLPGRSNNDRRGFAPNHAAPMAIAWRLSPSSWSAVALPPRRDQRQTIDPDPCHGRGPRRDPEALRSHVLETADYWISVGLTIGLERPHQARRLLELIEATESERTTLAEDAAAFIAEALE